MYVKKILFFMVGFGWSGVTYADCHSKVECKDGKYSGCLIEWSGKDVPAPETKHFGIDKMIELDCRTFCYDAEIPDPEDQSKLDYKTESLINEKDRIISEYNDKNFSTCNPSSSRPKMPGYLKLIPNRSHKSGSLK